MELTVDTIKKLLQKNLRDDSIIVLVRQDGRLRQCAAAYSERHDERYGEEEIADRVAMELGLPVSGDEWGEYRLECIGVAFEKGFTLEKANDASRIVTMLKSLPRVKGCPRGCVISPSQLVQRPTMLKHRGLQTAYGGKQAQVE